MLGLCTFVVILLVTSNAQLTTAGSFSDASATKSTNDISPFVDIFDCTCDYLSDICDTYCCCDPDCQDSLKSDWTNDGLCTETVDVGGMFIKCPDEGLITLLTDPKSQQNVALSQISTFLCIEYDMAPYAGYFYLESDDTSSRTSRESNFNTRNTEIDDDISSAATYSKYQRGIKLYSQVSSPIVSTTAKVAKFTIPKASPFGYCENTYSGIYLEDLPLSSCTRKVTMDNDCATLFSQSYYTTAIRPLSIPSTSSSSTVLTFTIRNVRTNNGASDGAASASETSGVCTCKNAVKMVDYYMVYDSSGNIDSAFVDLVLENVDVEGSCTDTTTVDQSFGLHFVTSANVYAKSGSPGYLVGKPLLIGTLNSATSPDTISRDIGGFYATGINAAGECLTTATSLESVYRSSLVPNFGQNSTFSCFVTLASELDLTGTKCSSSYVQSLVLFQNFEPTGIRVGRFGSSNVHYISDWISIDQETTLAQTTAVPTGAICNLPLDEEIYVFYAQFGLESNLLNYVVKVVRTFVNRYVTYDSTASQNILQFSQKIKYIKVTELDL